MKPGDASGHVDFRSFYVGCWVVLELGDVPSILPCAGRPESELLAGRPPRRTGCGFLDLMGVEVCAGVSELERLAITCLELLHDRGGVLGRRDRDAPARPRCHRPRFELSQGGAWVAAVSEVVGAGIGEFGAPSLGATVDLGKAALGERVAGGLVPGVLPTPWRTSVADPVEGL